jgi:hypothetical protein
LIPPDRILRSTVVTGIPFLLSPEVIAEEVEEEEEVASGLV